MQLRLRQLAAVSMLACGALAPLAASAQGEIPARQEVTYADYAQLAESAGLVVRAQVLKLARVEDERAPGLTPDHGRFYVEGKTLALLTGKKALGESIRYLVDLPLDARGKPPRLKKQIVFLFARAVPGRPGELQLVTPTAQRIWTASGEVRVRAILQALVSHDAPAKITGVRELLYVPGNLAGQGTTQIFLKTQRGSAASITVEHQPGQAPAWGVSFSELVADVGNPPRRDTLEWYRLACFLPNTPPPGANLSSSYARQQQALVDYHKVLADLGVCNRTMS